MIRLELWPVHVSQMEIMDLNSVMVVAHRAETIAEKRSTLTYDEEYSEKMNALDLVINVLKDHERRLDELLWRLEAIVEDHRQGVREDEPERFKKQRRAEPRVTQCKGWAEFKEKSKGARRTAFKVEEKILTVESLTEEAGYRYVETLRVPVDKLSLHIKGYENKNIENVESVVGIFKKKLECGLQASVKSLKFRSPEGEEILVLFYYIDPEDVKGWLSKELMVPEEDVAAGRLIF